jgi:hypothetical protein
MEENGQFIYTACEQQDQEQPDPAARKLSK